MSSRDSDPSVKPADAEPVLQRWSRLKAQARAAEQTEAQPATKPLPVTPTATSEAASLAEPPRVELPDLDLLGQDSDYSAFLAPGVDLSLRRRALRKLFASPKFNVFDGLDTYRDDFTSFPALGDIVTSDMRHQVERLARKALESLDGHAADEPVPAITAPTEAPATAVSADTVDHVATPALPASALIPTTAGQPTPTHAPAVTLPAAPSPASTADTASEQPLAPTEKE